jgi:hypothetical protein
MDKKYPVLNLLAKIATVETLLLIVFTIWLKPTHSDELGDLVIVAFLFISNSIVSIVFFFLHNEIRWKAWLLTAIVSPVIIGVLFHLWITVVPSTN